MSSRAGALGLLASVLAGCAAGTPGSARFACPGMPGEPLCLSATEVYEATEASETPAGARGVAKSLDAGAAARELLAAPRAPAPGPLPDPRGPVALRTPARVMRIWIAPYEDAAGDLHAPGYLFTEIEARRWSIGVARPPAATGRVTPLQVGAPAGHRPAPSAPGPGARE